MVAQGIGIGPLSFFDKAISLRYDWVVNVVNGWIGSALVLMMLPFPGTVHVDDVKGIIPGFCPDTIVSLSDEVKLKWSLVDPVAFASHNPENPIDRHSSKRLNKVFINSLVWL
jgi:hypothetical protein